LRIKRFAYAGVVLASKIATGGLLGKDGSASATRLSTITSHGRDGPRALAWKTDTYGGSNGTTMTIRNLAAAKFVVEFRIPNYVHDNTVQRWEVSGADLLQAGDLRFDVGGIEMFVALERMTDAPLPRRLTGTFKAKPGDGASCVYVRARQFDGHEAWTSPLFFNFPQHRLDGVYGAPGAHGHDHEEGEHGHEHGGDGHRH